MAHSTSITDVWDVSVYVEVRFFVFSLCSLTALFLDLQYTENLIVEFF